MDLFERLKKAKEEKEAAARAATTATTASTGPALAVPPTLKRPVSLAKPQPDQPRQATPLLRPPVAPTMHTPLKHMHSEETAPENHDDPEQEHEDFDFSGLDLDGFDLTADSAEDENVPGEHPSPSPAPASAATPALSAGHSHPAQRPALQKKLIARPSFVPAQRAPEPAPAPEPDQDAPSGSSILANLQARKAAATAPLQHPAAAAKKLATEISDFSIEELMAEWPSDEDDYTQDLIAERAALLKRASAHLQTMFSQELDTNSVIQASDIAIAEISKIAKMCFQRVRQSPSAYDMLDQLDRDAMIKALLLSASKRSAMAKGRKPKEAAALSSAMEALTSENPGLADLMSDLKLEF